MKCKEKGENIEALRIIPSKNNMKNRHPFQEKLEEKKNVEEQLYKEKIKKLNQSSFQLEQGFTKAFRNVSKVENEEIRESLKKAIKAQYDEKNN